MKSIVGGCWKMALLSLDLNLGHPRESENIDFGLKEANTNKSLQNA